MYIRNVPVYEYDNAFGTDSFVFPVVYIGVGTVWIVSMVVHYITIFAMRQPERPDIIFMAISVVSAFFMAIFAIEMYKYPRRGFISALSITPVLFMCTWLFLIYRDNASNPILLSYVYMCLAIMFSALGFYINSCFAFGRSAIGKGVVFYSAAAFFCIVVLADDISMSFKLFFGAVAFLNLFNLSALLRNLQRKRKYIR